MAKNYSTTDYIIINDSSIWSNNPVDDSNDTRSYLPISSIVEKKLDISKLQEVTIYSSNDNTNTIETKPYPWHEFFNESKEFFVLTNYLDRDLINLLSYNGVLYANLDNIHISIKQVDENVLAEEKDNTSSDLINFEEVLYEQKYPSVSINMENFTDMSHHSSSKKVIEIF